MRLVESGKLFGVANDCQHSYRKEFKFQELVELEGINSNSDYISRLTKQWNGIPIPILPNSYEFREPNGPVGYHPDFENSRCLFIVRKDGEMVDFSYWKCIKGLIRKNYPLYADSFILRHFRRRRHND